MKKDTLTHQLETTLDYPRLIRLDTVLEITTLSVSTIYRQIAKGQFPKQRKISERSTRWVESEVIEYINDKINNT